MRVALTTDSLYPSCVYPKAASTDIGGPAPGYRGNGDGALWSVGNDECSWSSTVSSTNGMHLYFSVTDLDPSRANSRGYGFQLRCLSE